MFIFLLLLTRRSCFLSILQFLKVSFRIPLLLWFFLSVAQERVEIHSFFYLILFSNINLYFICTAIENSYFLKSYFYPKKQKHLWKIYKRNTPNLLLKTPKHPISHIYLSFLLPSIFIFLPEFELWFPTYKRFSFLNDTN